MTTRWIKTVLLVEDSPGDVRLTKEAFREVTGFVQLQVVTDGAEAAAATRMALARWRIWAWSGAVMGFFPGKDGGGLSEGAAAPSRA